MLVGGDVERSSFAASNCSASVSSPLLAGS
jgi:hypothetical protein